MPLFDEMYYDQKWSLWDTASQVYKKAKGYLKIAAYRMGNIVTAQTSHGEVVTTQKSQGKIITGG